MAIKVKDHKYLYAPAAGKIEQLEAVYNFSVDGGAVDSYELMTFAESIAIHSIHFMSTESFVGSSNYNLNLGGIADMSSVKDANGLSLGKTLSVDQGGTVVYTVETEEVSGETGLTPTITVSSESEGSMSFPLVVEPNFVGLSLRLKITEAVTTAGKGKLIVVFSKSN